MYYLFSMRQIILKKVAVHNLKEVNLTLNHNQLIAFTGVSGSGKSSLAFSAIYVEGQRRYLQSLSTYARRHLGDLPKPKAESIEGISPTVAIEQKTAGRNPRSTVGTITQIYDYLRVLFARVGIAHCPISKQVVTPQSMSQITRRIQKLKAGTKILILAPYASNKKAEFKEDFKELLRKGFTKVLLDGKVVNLTEEIAIDGKVAHNVDLIIDRLALDPDEEKRLLESISQALEAGLGVMRIILVDTQEELLFSEHAFSSESGLSYAPLEPSDFSFNHPKGMCPRCLGLGRIEDFDLEKIINPNLSIKEDCCTVAGSYNTVRWGNIYDNLARIYGFNVSTPWKDLSDKAKQVFLYGIEQKWTRMKFVHPIKKTRWTEYVHFKGVLADAKERYTKAQNDIYLLKIQELLVNSLCPSCLGDRIKPYPAAATIGSKRIAEITHLSIHDAYTFFENLILTDEEQIIAEELLKEIKQRLAFLKGVGLHYLSLERSAPTLSGGETQRVRLATQIGSGLVGATYVLDEPSVGLHPQDNIRLLHTLRKLQELGNTVIVVEHDEETIRAADTIVDVGPRAGKEGGEIISCGSLEDLLNNPSSITGAYLSGKLKIPIPKRRTSTSFLTIEEASHHNLQQVTVKIPLHLLVAITGVSGSGKSSLITDTLYPILANALHHAKLPIGAYKNIEGIEKIDKVIAIDQTPIGRTPRSNPATFIKLFDYIRDLYSQLPQSIAQGYTAGRFSFNVKEGSCMHCHGMGMIKVDMDFMEDEWVECTVCEGKRFDENTLSITYKGKTIYDVLEMTIAEASVFFSSIPHIHQKLDMLHQVGLEYLKLGQASPTLSGGEAQRIKLAKELSRSSRGHTMYILDEPTTGLHFYDIDKLLQVLQKLVNKGHSVLVIEHNIDLIKTADWVIELGPEGGEKGGKVIASTTPEKMAKMHTPTAFFIKQALKSLPLLPPASIIEPDQQNQLITVIKASQNNLKEIDVSIPRNKITLCTGPSGSGKSSLAFETLYAEGQRRYIESLSPYARQFVKQMPKPKVESIENLSAAIAIEQKNHAGNPRSTIGTMTEIYDFLRILYAHLGIPHCPETKEQIRTISKQYVLKNLTQLPLHTKIQVLSPIELKRSESFTDLTKRLQKLGYLRIRLDSTYFTLDDPIPFDPNHRHQLFLVIDRLQIESQIEQRLLDAIEKASDLSKGSLVIALEDRDLFFNLSFAVPSTGKSYPPITPHTFSFNTEQGMCLECHGLGFQYGADLCRFPEVMKLSSYELICIFWKEEASKYCLKVFYKLIKKQRIDPDQPIQSLLPEQIHFLFNGAKETISLDHLELQWLGFNPILANLAKLGDPHTKQILSALLNQSTCFACQGTRLNPLARHVTIKQISIAELCRFPIDQAIQFVSTLTADVEFMQDVLDQITQRLKLLQMIGLGYLSLERSAPTLSGGETQRIRLARQIGSGLTGCLYVLDEPTIGLHPYDNEKLNRALLHLCELGNTLVLVEHDPLTIQLADYVLDFGPKAGKEGGKIIAQGTLQEIKDNPHSLTGAYLTGKKKIPLPSRRKPSCFIKIKNAHLHNLKKITTQIPLHVWTCLSGVSGSGKSTLLTELIYPAALEAIRTKKSEFTYSNTHFSNLAVDKVLMLDQNPIGQTNRSDITTYVDLLTSLRLFFSALPEAKRRGLVPKNFSFNHPKGMCTTCQGHGTRRISLQFLPDVSIVCESCKGFRLNALSLTVTYKGQHLGHILHMTVEQALSFLPPIPKVIRILQTLQTVGLGYLALGQEIATLSGGEAQRLRLSRELSKSTRAHTLYLLDEPSVGLHADDIAKLVPIFQKLVDKGHTVIMIEHNLDLLSSADYLIDLGPGSGLNGGEIMAKGTPEEVAKSPKSRTAPYLKEHLAFLKK
ncbi:excinuclease ABC subunit UvrA [Candidatus Rhabdochlamydia sp. T3358]|uniref:excinuclease ABC subunit UvrA n=1 Tax=Candidatus Rhabdochlamydia sp. T3358 TaxID=2099795 RepID=UPI0010B137F4|nr:excinuclease ABC subunit UvrA [Candidatus Rhabdochlamydia sp. T3358]VHO02977.1 UvrABC system protein A [Candidatus Rhabdochlamydia sp. T3358]